MTDPTTAPARKSASPIDARQHTWWHRLRRLTLWGFTLLFGAVAAPLLTVVLFGGVVWYFGYPWSTFWANGTLIWIASSPVYVGACYWTYKHMEGRYHATLATRCPRCGYSLEGRSDGDRCPECGAECAA